MHHLRVSGGEVKAIPAHYFTNNKRYETKENIRAETGNR